MRISDWSSDVCSSDLWKNPALDKYGINGGRHNLHSCFYKYVNSGCGPKITIGNFGFLLQLLRRAAEHHMASVQQVATVGHGQRRLDVLLDHDDGSALLGQFLTDIHEVAHNKRGKPLEGPDTQ